MKSTGNVLVAQNDRAQWTRVLELAGKEVFGLMLGTELTTSSESVPPAMDMTAMVGLAGHVCGVMSVRCDRGTAALMAARMLGAQAALGGQEVQDAFGEIGNMIAGNFKHKISGATSECMLSVPTVISGADYSVRSLADSDSFEVTLLFEGKPFAITLQIHS